jgi:hypothetical protein
MIPTNVADAAAAIKGGEIGLIPVIKIGDLTISALTGLSGPDAKTITRKPVEAGFTITDAAVKVPFVKNLDICLANPSFAIDAGISAALTGDFAGFTETWRDKKDQLYQIFNDTEIVDVQTHEDIYESAIIEVIDPFFDVAENSDAFFARVTVSEIMQVKTIVTSGILDQPKVSVGGL